MLRDLKKSNELKDRAKKVIPHYTGTFSRSAPHFVEGVFPVYVKEAKGSHFTDVDGNEYLDYLCGLGPITLGYNYEPVNEAIKNQLRNGILFSLPPPIEVELSEKVVETIPHADMVKFEKSGSNAVTGAVRAARYLTKKDKIAYCGSGGVWHDWQAAMVSRDGGVPHFNSELIKIFEYNDIEGLMKIFNENKDEIATIILEPAVFDIPKNDFLNKVRKIADENEALLIFDEVITGFRFDLGGAQKYFDVKADLVCFGKGMGNGLPISAITGPDEFMKSFDDLWVSSTNNSEALSLAGTMTVINEMKSKNTIPSCWKIGSKLMDGWNKITEENNLNIKLKGYPVRMFLECLHQNGSTSPELRALVLQEMVKKEIFFSPSIIFLSYSHSAEDIDYTLDSLIEICQKLSKIDEKDYHKYLEGKMPTTVWTMKIPPTKAL